ncbi:MAG: hypothetical protein P9L99_01550 [Candidatus Lernaella stagnicola]|nr:hypothetical protein [Candidatus Lernaella stagnicola]
MSSQPLTPDQLKLILDSIQAIGGTIINIRRYPTGSSLIKMALERATSQFDRIFEEMDSFTVSESEKQILINDERLPEKLANLAFVVRFLSTIMDRNVRSLTFSKGLTARELKDFIELLGHHPDELKTMGAINDLLQQTGVEHITIDAKVFVAIRKDQVVAEINALEGLRDDMTISAEGFQDSTFIKYLLTKLRDGELAIPEAKLKEIKSRIDFDKLADAKNIDYDKVGPLISSMLEAFNEDIRQVEEMPDTDMTTVAVAADIAPSLSPELFDAIRSQTLTVRQDAAESERDDRVHKLTKTFEGISQAIFGFKQPAVRTKLLNDFLTIVTNFKTRTLGQMLLSRLADNPAHDKELKAHVISTLSLKKKSALIDLFLGKYQRWIEGLSPADFEVESTEVEKAEDLLKKLLGVIRRQKSPPELEEKARRALAVVHNFREEAPTPEKLLILKVRRLLSKDPSFLVEEKIEAFIPDLLLRLVDMKRPDVAKKILEKLNMNVQSEDEQTRLRVAGTIVRVSQQLLDANAHLLHGTIFGLLLRDFRREKEQRVFAAFLAALVSDLGRLIDEGHFNLAIQVFKGISTLKDNEDNPVKIKFLEMAEKKITSHAELLDHLVKQFTEADEKQSDLALQILLRIDESRTVMTMFDLLLNSEEMRVRKKAMHVLTRIPEAAGPQIRDHLSKPEHPWYFVRNLIHLAGDMKAAGALPEGIERAVAAHAKHENEQVRKVCLSTLVKIGNDNADGILAEMLPKLDEGSRRIVINHMGHRRSPQAIEYMLGLLEPGLVDRDEEWALELISAFGRIGDERAVPPLKKTLKPGGLAGLFKRGPNEKVIAAILRALGNIGGEDTKSIVSKFTHDANANVSRAAQDALRNLSAE